MSNDPQKYLASKRIVITGASMGIGRAVAKKLSESGAQLVVNARGEDTLRETVNMITQNGGKVVARCGSVADYSFAEGLIETCINEFGGIDALINCAGIAEPYNSSILNIESADWHRLIDVHLHGTFNTCRHAAPVMEKQKYGVIINTGSHAFLGMYGGTGYAAGKGAVTSLTMALAMDLHEKGIRVNVICPGAKTRLSTGPDYESLISNLNVRGLLDDCLMESSLNPPDPSYVAPLYAFLVSDSAKDITGRIFWAAGGYIGQFNRNSDQLLGFKDHEIHSPWTQSELEKCLRSKHITGFEEQYNVLFNLGPFRFLVKQKMLLKLATSKIIKAGLSVIKSWTSVSNLLLRKNRT